MNGKYLVAAIAFGVAAVQPADADTDFHQRLDATADGTVDISNVAGELRIVGWDRNEVEVEGTLGADVERVEFAVEGDRTVVRVHLPKRDADRRRQYNDADADLTIHVPRGSRVAASAVSADIGAEGLHGNPDLKSVSGDVTLAGTFKQADVQSVSGSVHVQGSGDGARVRAVAVSGDVAVTMLDGELKASSVSGNVRVTAAGIRRADLSSTSGNVTYDAPLAADGRYEIGTISGSARLIVDGAAQARYELHTMSGSIRNGFGPKPRRVSEYGPGMILEFEEGEGAEVEMSSVSGALHLERK